jgi:hypothetical protein
MRTCGSKLRSKTSLQNCQKLENLLGNIKNFPRLKSNFPRPKSDLPQPCSDFCQRLSTFLYSFPIFLNGFLLSKKSKIIYLRRQVSKRLLFKLCISRHSLPELRSSRYNIYISPNTLLWCTCVPNSAPNLN